MDKLYMDRQYRCAGCRDRLPLNRGLHHDHNQPVMRCEAVRESDPFDKASVALLSDYAIKAMKENG